MKRTALAAVLVVVLASVSVLLLPGCRDREGSGQGASTEAGNVLWRNELFDFAMDTLLNRSSEFFSEETRQRTMNRLDQWIHQQKPLEDWKPDPVIAGAAEDLEAGAKQVIDLAGRISKLEQQGDAGALDELPGEFRSGGQRLHAAGLRLALLDVISLGSQMVVMADRLDEALADNSGNAEQAGKAIQTIFSKLDPAEFGRLGAEMLAFAHRIDPTVLGFGPMDSMMFQEAVWLRDVASWAGGDELDDPVKPAIALFDWVVKNVQLAREPQGDASVAQSHVFQTPWETLLFGRGTGIDRAWLFVLLARQKNIDAALLGFVDENNVLTKLWGVGVLIEGKIYLFEPVLGLPIPKPGAQKLTEKGMTFELATLAEAATDKAVLDQLDLFTKGDYVVRPEDLQRVVALVEAGPACVSERMKMVENRLTGGQKIVFTSDATAQIERFKQNPFVVDGRMWPLPYQTLWQEIRFARERQKWMDEMLKPFLFPPQMPLLWNARSYYFQGEFTGRPSAAMFYQAARRSDFSMDSENMVRENKQMWQDIKIDASYWLGLMMAQSENYRAAEDYLKTRVLAADPGGKWESGAAYNLARVAEKVGDVDLAIDLLEIHTGVPQAQGNLIRARWLRKAAGKPVPALKDPEAAKESAEPEKKKDSEAAPEGESEEEPSKAKPAEEPSPEPDKMSDQPEEKSSAPDKKETPPAKAEEPSPPLPPEPAKKPESAKPEENSPEPAAEPAKEPEPAKPAE